MEICLVSAYKVLKASKIVEETGSLWSYEEDWHKISGLDSSVVDMIMNVCISWWKEELDIVIAISRK